MFNKIYVPNNYVLHILLCFIVTSSLVGKTAAVGCYECDSSDDLTCGETLADGHILEPGDCSQLQEPLYCVKMTGLYEAFSLSCYQCDSSQDNFCPETLLRIHKDAGYLALFQPKSCSSVFDASYCVKTTGLYAGQLGTKRFCSARDFGNYCEMVRRPGDERLYRACIYTCQSHACNSSTNIKIAPVAIASCFLITLLLQIKCIAMFS